MVQEMSQFAYFPYKYIAVNSFIKGHRPGFIYLFRENKEWNSLDNLKIFGCLGQHKALQNIKFVFEINSFYKCDEILIRLPNLSSITINLSKGFSKWL